MENKIYKFISCLLALALIMTISSATIVLATDDLVNSADKDVSEDFEISITMEDAEDSDEEDLSESNVEESGLGTPEDPKVKTTTTVETDEEYEETITTVEKEKEWQDESTEGEEKSKTEETVDSEGELISATGEAEGKETTVLKNEEENKEEKQEEVVIENGKVTTEDGKTIETEAPEVTVELEPGKTDEKTEEMDAWFDEDTLDIPEWIKQKEGETSTWITEDSSKEEDGNVTNVTVETVDNSTTYTRKITAPDGKVTEEKITYTRDAKGRITGFETETKETVSETTEETTPPENAEIHADGGWKELVYELPEKPEVEEAERDEEGNVINGKVVAEIHDKDGNVAGYTEVEIKNGKVVKYSNPIMGKLISKETKVETLENGLKKYTVTKTTLTRNSVKKASGSVSGGERTVDGEMGQINGSVTFDYGSLETFLPDFTIAGTGGEGFNDEQDIAKINSNFVKDYDENGKYFQWLGQLGLFSLIYIRDGDGDVVTADQFEIVGKDGKKYYAYCADLGVYAQEGAQYNMQRLEDADYIQHKDKVRSIVLKGYWGVKNESEDANNPSTGSFAAFKKMLLDNKALTKEESDNLTDGMALLATQAAIWRYGNSGQNMLDENLEFPYNPGESKSRIINKAYQYLVGLKGTPACAANTIFTKGDFAKMVDLTVKEKSEDDKYDTDVKVAMAVEFDDETSDLKLYVTADGEKIDEYRLAGALQEGEKKAIKNADGTYTLSGLKLKGNTKFNINLKGVQNLKDGVYIFSCNAGPNGHPAQTFVGAGESKQDIDLKVDLKFNLKEKATYVSAKSESEVEALEWKASYYTFEETDTYDDVEETEEEHDDVKETEEVVEEKPEDVAEENIQEIAEEKAEGTTEKDRNYGVPKTGDNLYTIQIGLLAGVLISLLGAALFAIKRIEDNERAKRS